MKEGVEGGHEEVPARHPLDALPFGALLTFMGGRRRRGARAAGRSAAPFAEQAPAVVDRRGIYSLIAAEAVGQVGNQMVYVAGPWFVLETTGSAARTGIVIGALAMGAVLPAVLGGPLVDRLGFKRSSVLADLASAATIAAVPLLYLADILQFWQLVLLVFVLSSLNSQGDTARYALVPFLADRARMPIERANGADRAIVRLGQVVGPVLGGILIAVIGAANVLFVDAVSFILSAILVAVAVDAGFLGGLLFGPIYPLASTVIQEHTPPQLLGRVFGALAALAQAGIPVGAVLAGSWSSGPGWCRPSSAWAPSTCW